MLKTEFFEPLVSAKEPGNYNFSSFLSYQGFGWCLEVTISEVLWPDSLETYHVELVCM